MATPAVRKPARRRRTVAPAPPSILERTEWEAGYLCVVELAANSLLFNLSSGDLLWCSRDTEPQPGQVVVFSLFDGETSIGRFHAWQWDEVLITDAEDNLRFVRPRTLVPVVEIERLQEGAA